MNTNTIIGVVVALVVIGGGAWYVSTHPAAPQEEVRQQTGEQSDAGTASFAAFLAAGGNRSCDVTVANPSAPATGVVYVSGNEVRSDLTATLGEEEIQAHMIQTNGYVYTWTDLMPQGVKVKAEAVAATGQGISSAIDPNAEVQYDCTPWVPDASKFEVPTSVTFMEFGTAGPK